MKVIQVTDEEIMCDECEVVFTLIYNNDGFTRMEYCPFCGSEAEYD